MLYVIHLRSPLTVHKEGIELAIKAFSRNSVFEGPSPGNSLTDLSLVSTACDRACLPRKCMFCTSVMGTRQMRDPLKNGSIRTSQEMVSLITETHISDPLCDIRIDVGASTERQYSCESVPLL